ncbi:hypothetical protein K470DRAFT_214573 [Piedraia hortae CBS 480.64]|uniref:Uncharacterized protein n=1 Tax=Piedraia hortae CBS 480.64 TaxID=1314780 RepID=A0A6A7C2V9_9PEZI|nr:hypothetical protein K470DRAFT_214573 [Piedraia hortae CBS 480.64]
MRPTTILRSGGPKVPYPKHVWSPAGGWYAQPKNWKQNTMIVGAAMTGICVMLWGVSADREQRDRMPDPDRFYPSRYWSRQIIEHERGQKS